MSPITWLIFVTAALLEVGGDAVIRKGLRGSSIMLIVAGFQILGCYGLLFISHAFKAWNLLEWGSRGA